MVYKPTVPSCTAMVIAGGDCEDWAENSETEFRLREDSAAHFSFLATKCRVQSLTCKKCSFPAFVFLFCLPLLLPMQLLKFRNLILQKIFHKLFMKFKNHEVIILDQIVF